MRSHLLLLTAIMAVSIVGLSNTAISGTIIVGGISFNDNAFADMVVSYTQGISFQRQITDPFDRVDTTPEDAVLGADLASSTIEMERSQELTVAFTDNIIVNGPGSDLAVFELFESPDYGNITINGITQAMIGNSLGLIPIPGTSFSNYVNLAEIDLSSFGVPLGGSITSLTVTGNGSEYAVFGAINSESPVPEPASLLLLGTGLAGIGLAAWRRKK